MGGGSPSSGLNCDYVCHVYRQSNGVVGGRRLLFGGLQSYSGVDTNVFVGCSQDMRDCGCCPEARRKWRRGARDYRDYRRGAGSRFGDEVGGELSGGDGARRGGRGAVANPAEGLSLELSCTLGLIDCTVGRSMHRGKWRL